MSLFRNQQENDSQPIYTNRKVILKERIILEADTPYEVAMWRKTKTADGKPVDMVSIKVEENDFLIAQMNEEENKTETKPDLPDDDIPF